MTLFSFEDINECLKRTRPGVVQLVNGFLVYKRAWKHEKNFFVAKTWIRVDAANGWLTQHEAATRLRQAYNDLNAYPTHGD